MKLTTRLLWIAPILTISTIGCSSDDDDKNSPVESGDVVVNPAVDSRQIDSAVADLMSTGELPGVAIGLVSVGSGVPVYWSKGYGSTDINAPLPVDEDTSFWMGSVSKAVLGTVMMMGQEQGEYTLDQDIRPLLAQSSGFTIGDPLDRDQSLRKLASHTSGIRDSDAYACSYYINNADGSQSPASGPLDFGVDCPEAGPTILGDYLAAYIDSNGIYYSAEDHFTKEVEPEFEYSNVGAGLAGHVIALAVNQPLDEYAKAILFDPLGMNNTYWNIASQSGNTLATPHGVDVSTTELPLFELATFPDGGLRSSASDMARFLAFVIGDGIHEGQRLIQSASIAEMFTPGVHNPEYGLFWELEDGLIGHSGSDPGATTYMFFDPETRTGIVILLNADDEKLTDDETETLIELLFDSATSLES